MTAAATINGGYKPVNEHDAIPAFLHRKLAGSAQVGRGQFVTVSLSTGYAALNDGATPNQASAGTGDPSALSDTDTTAGNAAVRLSQRWLKGLPASTVSQDGFADTDFGVPFYIADENTPGKKSNNSGNNRSLGGLVFGLGDDSNPILWDGPVAWLLARATLVSNAKLAGWYAHPVDGAANTTTAEKTIFREALHGVVTAVYFDTLGTLAADNTDYVTINVYKADGAGGTHVLIASYDSRAAHEGALAAGVPKAFSLSAVAGALNLLETDILSYEVLKSGAGKIVPVGTLRVVQKVI